MAFHRLVCVHYVAWITEVLSDRRNGQTQLIGETDDLVSIYDTQTDEDTVFAKWESDKYDVCKDALQVLKRWKGMKRAYEARDRQKEVFQIRLTLIHSGNFKMFTSDDEDTENTDDNDNE